MLRALSTISSSSLLAAALAVLAFAILLTWAVTRWRHIRRAVAMQARLQGSEDRYGSSQLENARLKSQVDALRAELREQKALLTQASAKARAAPQEDSWSQVQAMNDLFVEPRHPRRVVDFEDTQIL